MKNYKIVVINGSPNGENISTTMQYIKYLKQEFPMHSYQIINVGKEINKIVSNEILFEKYIDQIENADIVMWASPVYFLLVPYQLKRFIELIYEKKKENVFNNKYAISLVTSVNFFDNIASDYLSQISESLNMINLENLTFSKHELMSPVTQERFKHIFNYIFIQINDLVKVQIKHVNLEVSKKIIYKPITCENKIDLKNAVVITDSKDYDNTKNILNKIKSSVENIEVINLHNVDIKSGCTSCMKCTDTLNCCIKDGYREFFDKSVRDKSTIIFVSEVKDKFLSARMKLFFDRMFFSNHIPVLKDKQIGFICVGDVTPIIRDFASGVSQFQQANLIDIISDNCQSSDEFDSHINLFLKKAEYYSVNNVIRPNNFLGVGGRKVLRDVLVKDLRYAFLKDYEYYKKNKLLDFPQYDWTAKRRNMKLLAIQMIPGMKKKIREDINAKIVMPFKKILND